jgi:PAS domain S-box-containing protein
LVLDGVSIPVLCCDAAGRITLLNKAACELFNIDAESALDRPLSDWFADWVALLKVRTGFECNAILTDGRRIALAIDVQPIGAPHNAGFVLTLHPRTAVTQGAWDSARLSAIVESSDDAIIGKTLDGIITSWNKGAQRIFGYTAEEMIGRHISQLIPADRQEEEPDIQNRLRLGQRVDHFDTLRIAKDGRQIHVSLTISPVRDGDGAIVGASKIARDITERKTAEEATRLRDAELAHLSRVSTMGNMASGLAHELNQPLGAILNYAGMCQTLLKSQVLAVDRFRDAIEEVMVETRRAGTIISRLRSFVSKQTPRPASLDLNELVRKTIVFLDYEFRNQHVQPLLLLCEHLLAVNVDAIQIEQVVVNLIYNAIQAMSDTAQADRKLIIQTQRGADGFAQVSVIDSGPGMSQETLQRLFQPFFTTKPQGMGMGLNISRSIIEAHLGRLWATVNETGGMRFSFTLPIKLPIEQSSTEPPLEAVTAPRPDHA